MLSLASKRGFGDPPQYAPQIDLFGVGSICLRPADSPMYLDVCIDAILSSLVYIELDPPYVGSSLGNPCYGEISIHSTA